MKKRRRLVENGGVLLAPLERRGDACIAPERGQS